VQGAVLSSLLATGPVRRRYGPHPPGPADERFFILCNLAIRRRALRPFVEALLCAEENALLADLAAHGSVMHYDPELVVYHERRATWGAFARQMVKYGIGRGQLFRRDRSTIRVAYLLPSLLLLYAATLPAMVWLSPLALAPAGLYLLVVAAAALKVVITLRRIGPRPFVQVAGVVVVLHGCYGVGVIRGVLRGDGSPPASTNEWLSAANADTTADLTG
jgi:hypothetical protein